MVGHGSMVDPELTSEVVQRAAGFIPGHYGAKVGRSGSALDFDECTWCRPAHGGGVGTAILPTGDLRGRV